MSFKLIIVLATKIPMMKGITVSGHNKEWLKDNPNDKNTTIITDIKGVQYIVSDYIDTRWVEGLF